MPRPIRSLPAPSNTDVEMRAVLWDRPSATGRAIYVGLLAVGRRRRIAYTTVKTYLDRLVRKGYSSGHPLEDLRGTYVYTAAASREVVRDHSDLLTRLVRVFRLTPAAFIRWCHAHGQLTPQDQAALHTLLHDMSAQALPPTAQLGRKHGRLGGGHITPTPADVEEATGGPDQSAGRVDLIVHHDSTTPRR
jgi:predicted transcriptional regulator